MALDLTQSWVGRNFEKLVLLAAATLLAAAIAGFVVFRESQGGATSEIQTLVSQIKHERAHATLAAVLSKENRIRFADVLTGPQQQEARQGLSPEEQARFDEAAKPFSATEFFSQLQAPLPPWDSNRCPFSPPPLRKKTVVPITATVVPKLPARVLPVERIEAAVGRGVTKDTVPAAQVIASMEGTGLSDIAWVSLAGQFDLTRQFQLNKEGHSPYPLILVSDVALQRRTRTPDGWSQWEDVPRAVPDVMRDKLPAVPANTRDNRVVYEWGRAVESLQRAIRRPPFYKLLAVEGQTIFDISDRDAPVARPSAAGAAPPAPKPVAHEPREVRSPTPAPTAPSSLGSGMPWETPPVGGLAEPEQPPPMFVEPEHTYATVWASDLSVRPGRTYQYRMRVSVFNPIYGQSGAQPQEDAWKLTLQGEWSQPGPEVTVPALVDYYFVGSGASKVNLELHRWIHGQWAIVPSAQTALGEPVSYRRRREPLVIPGTSGQETRIDIDFNPGAILVDQIREFPYRPAGNNQSIRTDVLVVSDLQGNISHRIQWEDAREAVINRIARKAVVPTPLPGPEYIPWDR